MRRFKKFCFFTLIVSAVVLVGCGPDSSSNGDSAGSAEVRGNGPPEGGNDCVTGVTDGFGLRGSYPILEQSFAHPSYATGEVTVMWPIMTAVPESGIPVIFFSHAFSANEFDTYRLLLEMLASRGNIVVHSPYQVPSSLEILSLGDYPVGYDELWEGFTAAVENYSESLSMDLHRVGFIGHSFGGGATPAMLNRALDQGWGSVARYAMIMAPFKVFDITPEQFALFPVDTHVAIHVYDDDDTNDHRFAIEDIWKHLDHIPLRNKDFLLLPSASQGVCSMPSDHSVPMQSSGRYGKLDAYDLWAVWRHADAISRCTFAQDNTGCTIALGHGDPIQAGMGMWVETGDPVPSFVSTIPPLPTNCGEGESCTFKRGRALTTSPL